jgi:polysaccharide export outer membrane protein
MGRRGEELLIGWLVLSPLIVACASAPTPAPAPTPTATEAKPPESTYIIQPGDPLEVFVWRHPELSETVTVQPDGKISAPYVWDMVAAGKTPEQLARDIEEVLSKTVVSKTVLSQNERAPKVNIIVTRPFCGSSVVKVVGQVAHPSALPYHEGMRVLDAILGAGGLTQFTGATVRASCVRRTARRRSST